MSEKGSPLPAEDKDPEEEQQTVTANYSDDAEGESSAISKRKRDDDEEEEQSEENTSGEVSKRVKESDSPIKTTESALATSSYAPTSSAAASTGIPADYKSTHATLGAVPVISHISPAGDNEIIEIPPEKVGQVIGTKGAVIQDMQIRTGAKIFVKQDFPAGVNRQVTIAGNPVQVKAAGDLVRLIIENGPTAIHTNSISGGPVLHIVVDCAQALVGRVIGASGSTIKELQTRTGAKIQIDQNYPDGAPRKINVSGTQAAINMATQLISFVMENGPTLPPIPGQGIPNLPGLGGGGGLGLYGPPAGGVHTVGGAVGGVQHQVMECAKGFVGKIIGRGGEVITMIQQKSGAKVQIDQNVPEGTPCKINMSGLPPNLAIAVQLIQEAMLGTRPGGGGGPGGPGMGGPWGGPGGPQGMQQGYGGGLQQGYGGVQQGYGGIPGYGIPPGGVPGGMIPGANPYGGGGYGMPPQQQIPGYPQPQQQQQQPYGQQAGFPGYPQQQQQQQLAQQQQQQQHNYGAYGHQQAAPVAAPAAAPKPASVWSEHKTDDGNVYWYNATTGVSQWERPAGV